MDLLITDSNLLVHWPWIQAKPWCTGKQLPPGFNPMDLLIIMTKYTLILAPLEVFAKRTFLGQDPGLQLSRVLSKWKIK